MPARCYACSQIQLEDRSGTTRSASLDRIRSDEGYTLGNIQWVHKDVNMMKRNFPEARFFELCRAVAHHLDVAS